MAYNRHTWTDRIIEFANRFRVVETADEDVIDLERITGEVTEAGTPITAAWLNEMEAGIEGAAPEDHTHGLPQLLGVLPIDKGGTGAATRKDALENLKAFGYLRSITAGEDMDNITTPGSYYVAASSAASIVNGPFASGAYHVYVRCADDSGNRIVQEATPSSSGHSYFGRIRYRTLYATPGSVSASDWKTYATEEGKVASATAADTAAVADKAAKLSTARNFRVDLASTSSASFDGSNVCTPGVKNTLPIRNGGTGATTKAAALDNLGAAAANHTHTASDISGKLPINKGGTNATTASGALSNLGAQKNIAVDEYTNTPTDYFTMKSGVTAAYCYIKNVAGKWMDGWIQFSAASSDSSGTATLATLKKQTAPYYRGVTGYVIKSGESLRRPVTGMIDDSGKLELYTGLAGASFQHVFVCFNVFCV